MRAGIAYYARPATLKKIRWSSACVKKRIPRVLPSVRLSRIILNEKRNHSRGRHLNVLLPYAEQFDGFARYLAWHAFTDDRWVTEQLLANCRYFFLLLPHVSNDRLCFLSHLDSI